MEIKPEPERIHSPVLDLAPIRTNRGEAIRTVSAAEAGCLRPSFSFRGRPGASGWSCRYTSLPLDEIPDAEDTDFSLLRSDTDWNVSRCHPTAILCRNRIHIVRTKLYTNCAHNEVEYENRCCRIRQVESREH